MTAGTAETWREICEDFKSVGEPDQYNPEEFNAIYPAFAGRGGDACNWSVTGFTPQGMISFQNYLDRVLFYLRQLEDQNQGFREIIDGLTEE